MGKRCRDALAVIVAWCMALGMISGAGAEDAFAEKTDAETGYAYVVYEESAGGGVAVRRAKITGYEGVEGDLQIPGKIGDYEVGGIGAQAFQGNADIVSVTIPEGVAHIGREAFQGCESLVRVAVPSTITDWDDDLSNGYDSSAFRGCAALVEVALAEGLAVLGQRAFADCPSLERIAIPSTVKEFHNQTFSGCTALRQVDLPEGIEEIGYRAFADCTALEQVKIPSTVGCWSLLRASGIMATVRDCAPFSGCSSLKKIEFKEGIKTLRGFQGCLGCPLVEELDIPASVEDVSYAFANCTSLKKVILHDGLKSIGEGAFQGCTSLVEMQVPETVESLGANAFKDCTSLEKLVLPSATNSMEGGVTDGCTRLRELYLLSDVVKWYQGLQIAADGKLYCMEGSSTYNTYLSRMPESDRSKLTALPATGATVAGVTAMYDGNARGAVAVEGLQEGDEALYRVNCGISQKELPQITKPGNYQVTVMVKRIQFGKLAGYSCLRAESLIEKRQYAMHLPDLEAEEGEDYVLTVQGYEGDGEPEYTYYADEACTQAQDGKPGTEGVYYVRASIPETDYDKAVVSNTARITIHGKEMPGADPSSSQPPGVPSETDPSPSVSPGASSGTEPVASQKPSMPSGTEDPAASPTPSKNPGGTSVASPSPGGSPFPSANPGYIPNSGTVREPKRTAKPQTVPKVGRVTIKRAKCTKKKTLLVQWKKVSRASGYQVQVGLDRKFAKGKKNYLVAKGKATKKIIKKLKRKKYYVRMRAYRKQGGKKYYGKWSKVKKALS